MGILFTAGEYCWHKPVPRSDARHVQATFERCKVHAGKSEKVTLYYSDYESPLSVPTECVTQELIQSPRSLSPGTVMDLTLHPRSEVILELSDHGRLILPFEETAKRLNTRVHSFVWLGLFCFLCAAFGARKLRKKEVF